MEASEYIEIQETLIGIIDDLKAHEKEITELKKRITKLENEKGKV